MPLSAQRRALGSAAARSSFHARSTPGRSRAFAADRSSALYEATWSAFGGGSLGTGGLLGGFGKVNAIMSESSILSYWGYESADRGVCLERCGLARPLSASFVTQSVERWR